MKLKVLLLLFILTLSILIAKDWWEILNLYKILPRLFTDSNGDGIGDLTERIYLQEIGVDAIWYTPFYKSPMVDFGYDVSDYRAIHFEYGTLNVYKHLCYR